ncbi:MAG: HAD family hydrolase [Ruminococcaceae bacterium]|nr:HAD family hydrolase [Oscillospiraceae bacterium]
MKYLIFLDIDGTLLSRGGVPQRTISAIQKAIEQGNLVFINTGRSKGNIPFSHLSDVPLTGIVAGLGAYIEVEGQVVFSHAMSNEEIAFAMQIASEIRTGLVLEGEQILLDYLPEYMNPHWRQNRPAVESVEDMDRRFPSHRISKISFTNPISAEAAEKLGTRLGVISHSTYAEIFSKGLSKATAMDFLKRRFAIADDHVIAMGDSHNDVEMLRAAGIAVVMGDGNPDVKLLADFISIPSHEGGVGQALEVLVLQP